MDKTDTTVISQFNNISTEESLLTYSEEEKQQNEINASNAKLVFSPKFIPIYPNLLNKLTYLEAIIFGFIDYYKSSSSERFYFTNEQIGKICNCNPDSVSRSIKKLESLKLIKTSRKIRAGGGIIRFVTDISYKSEPTFPTSPNRQIDSLYINNNKINNNKINILDAKRPLPANNIKKEPSEAQQLYRRIINHLQETLSMNVTSWGKQCSAIKSMLDAGYTELQITKTISYMANKDDFYSDKGFDMTTVAKQIPLYKAQMRKAAIT